jgi:hypothetical protein
MTTEVGYQEYSVKQDCLHFNQLHNGKLNHIKRKDWAVIGLCTIDASMHIAMYCDDVKSRKGYFDIRDVKIAYELYKDIK